MKLFRNAIILIVVLGLLVGAYFFINNKKSTTSEVAEESENTIYVLNVNQDDVTSLDFNNDKGTFRVEKSGDKWSLTPSSEFTLDTSIAQTALTDTASIVANKVVEEKATDLTKYGLDKPKTVKIGLKDGSSKGIEIGNKTPTNDGYYVRNIGESKIYVIGTYYEAKLLMEKSNFLVKSILPEDPTLLNKLSFEKNGELQYAVDIVSSDDMRITAPVKEVAETTKVSTILEGVVKLTVLDVVDENPTDLSKYGLDKPAYVIETGDNTNTWKIQFGKDVEKGSTAYAKLANGKAVFTTDVSVLTAIDMKFSDIVNAFVYLPNITDVSRVELFIDGKTIVSDISATVEKAKEDTFKVNGKDANMENSDGKSLFRAFYQAMIGITMNKYEPNAKPEYKPEVTILYHLKKDSKTVKVDFVSKDENYYYAFKDGVYTNRVFLKSKLDEEEGIRKSYKELKEAIDAAVAKKS